MQSFPELYPNTVKCLVQTLKKDGVFRGLYAGRCWIAGILKYGKAWSPLNDLIIIPGTNPALIANVAENSVLFCAYGVCQEQLLKLCQPKTDSHSNLMAVRKTAAHLPNKLTSYSLTPLGNATAGFFAAFFSSFSLCPTELIKCKLQAVRETGNLRV